MKFQFCKIRYVDFECRFQLNMEFTFYTVSECFFENEFYVRIATIYTIVKVSSKIIKVQQKTFCSLWENRVAQKAKLIVSQPDLY